MPCKGNHNSKIGDEVGGRVGDNHCHDGTLTFTLPLTATLVRCAGHRTDAPG